MKPPFASKPETNLLNEAHVQWNLSVPALVKRSLALQEGSLTAEGALAVKTGKYTGRSPKDKYIVDEPGSSPSIDWGNVNKPMSEEVFERLYNKVTAHLNRQNEVFAGDALAGADLDYQLPVRVITSYAWHQLFARQLFIRPDGREASSIPPFTLISAPECKADPEVDGTSSETFIAVSFARRTILIGGTEYAGEMKKSVFSVMNYLLPEQNVLPMHCSANIGSDGKSALFFGLSGTGKTTLSADPSRLLVGDDEHGWSENGIFNIEGGCYAKCSNLSKQKEPQIWNAIRFGAVLENVGLDVASGKVDYTDTQITENTRAAYPIEHVDGIVPSGTAGHPSAIIFLTADAFGVLPPISRLTKEQAMYHFLSGYTSKLAGTERGVTSPEATFSTCFGAPFLPRQASVYAEMLGEKIDEHNVPVFLVNTGWSGGGYGVGSRMDLSYTRAMVQAALNGELTDTATVEDPIFGLHIPESCPGVPEDMLQPKKMWKEAGDYEIQARMLARKFAKNFKRFYDVPASIADAGPTQL